MLRPHLPLTPSSSPTSRNLQATGKVRFGIGPTGDVVLIEGTVQALAATEIPNEVPSNIKPLDVRTARPGIFRTWTLSAPASLWLPLTAGLATCDTPLSAMVTIGVDVASQPNGTAACWIRWRDGQGTVQRVEQSIADDRLRSILLEEPAVKVGVDVPLGWPTAFVHALTAHHAGAQWPTASIRKLVRRVTDWHVHECVGQLPLSVSTDRIAYAALRVAALLPGTIDRRGDQRIVEVYPAAALRRWLLPWQRYKGRGRLVGLEELVRALRDVTKTWLVAGQAEWSRLAGSDDLFDAMVASLIARAKVLGLCEPVPPQHNEAARAEGWIALPLAGSLDELPGRNPGIPRPAWLRGREHGPMTQ